MNKQREELVRLAASGGVSVTVLCRRRNVCRQMAYKWRRRMREEGEIKERSRRPKHSPRQSSAEIEAIVLRIRHESNGAWGGRKIRRVMRNEGLATVPAASTITEILRRHGELEKSAAEHPGPLQRFERAAPNELWQMDFKGHFAVGTGRCYPLGALDDHSRYLLMLAACAGESEKPVRRHLTTAFRAYGLPLTMLMDWGSPWGEGRHTHMTVWLMRLGIRVIHGRVRHPQTQGKQERFHRSLNAEVLSGRSFADLDHCQRAFDAWRPVYNFKRPHDSLALDVPADRFKPSPRSFPETLEPIDYGSGAIVRRVDVSGRFSFQNQVLTLSKAFRGQPIALRPTMIDGVFDVHYCAHRIAQINLRAPNDAACGFVDNADALPTTPQAQQPQQPLENIL